MALADELLVQARQLAEQDFDGRPRQANLRRAISAAYYGVFHLLVADGAKRCSPKSPDKLSSRVARSFAHGEMRQVCRGISDRQSSKVLNDLLPVGFGGEIEAVASAFVFLQTQRHDADYDSLRTYSRVETLEVITRAEEAFELWHQVRNTDEANVFLAALLFGNRWAK